MSQALRRKQLIGVLGAAGGLLVLLAWFGLASSLFGGLPHPSGNAGVRLAYTARWAVAPGLTLLIGVWIAARRGFLPDAIDGTRTPASHALEINLRYNQNTVEQVVLAVIAWAALSVELPPDRLYLIPAMAAAFTVGRATFWVGYLIHPMGRAFGMVLTTAPTIGAYAWLTWRLVTGS